MQMKHRKGYCGRCDVTFMWSGQNPLAAYKAYCPRCGHKLLVVRKVRAKIVEDTPKTAEQVGW